MTEALIIERSGEFPFQPVLALTGPLTAATGAVFQNAMRREAPADTLIIDLSEVPYVDSSGLGLLVTAYVTREKAGRKMVLCGVNQRVQRLLEVTRTLNLFLIFSTPEEAISALASAGMA